MHTVEAPAKINLGLEVLARRADGYHNINTIFHRVGLADTVSMSRREQGVTLACNTPDIPTDARNLCVRAAHTLFAHAGFDGGVHIDLFKRIPDGAGLGGGSSNAAAVLRTLPALLDLDVTEDALHAIATSIGSDVPFFLHPGSAHATGRGERLTYIALALPYDIVVAHPGVRVPTAWAYGALALAGTRAATDLPALLRDHVSHPAVLRERLHNDFEAPVCAAFPQIAALRQELVDAGADLVLMSGSGSAVFALFSDHAQAAGCVETVSAPTVHLTPRP